MRKQPQPDAVSEAVRRYQPPNVPLSVIEQFARAIGEGFHPEQIILFGSFAHGHPHSESDVDLLVVMPTRNEVNQAIRITLALDPPFPLDLIVRTPENLRRGLAEEDWFLREVMATGKILYEKADHPLGPQG